MNDSVTIATSNPRSVLSGYQLHDNFSLTINNTKPSDSSTSYQCCVTIDDPRIPGTHDVVYDQNQLGLITVMVYGESPNKYIHAETYLVVCLSKIREFDLRQLNTKCPQLSLFIITSALETNK